MLGTQLKRHEKSALPRERERQREKYSLFGLWRASLRLCVNERIRSEDKSHAEIERARLLAARRARP